MHALKSLISKSRDRLATAPAAISGWYKRRKIIWSDVFNALTIAAFTIGVIALISLIWLYVRPIKTADIKVPVATDQASYHPGEEISGIFFGEVFYKGNVQVLREVFCKGYQNIIKPPESARNGDFYATQSMPRKIEGLSVTIGHLPDNIPIGSNCVLQFTNIYRIQTPFGLRQEEYQYYTQNFAIVTVERRQQLECEAAGRQDCDLGGDDRSTRGIKDPTSEKDEATIQSSPDSPSPQEATTQPQQPQNSSQEPNTNEMQQASPRHTAEPAPRFEERCLIDFIIKLGCRQVEVR